MLGGPTVKLKKAGGGLGGRRCTRCRECIAGVDLEVVVVVVVVVVVLVAVRLLRARF